MESEQDLLRETYRLSKENNSMLHAMRRSAFIGRILKVVIYGILFIILPIWIYLTYLAPIVDQMLKTMNQIQTAGTQAQNQMSDWQKAFQGFQGMFPGMSSSSRN